MTVAAAGRARRCFFEGLGKRSTLQVWLIAAGAEVVDAELAEHDLQGGAPAAAGGGGEDGAVGQHRGRCAPRLTAAVTVSTTSRRRRWRVSGTDPEGAVLASWYDPHSRARSLRKPEALHTGTPVRFTSYAATTRMRRSRSNVFHSARESAYAAVQRHSLPPHTRKVTDSIPAGTITSSCR